MLAPVAAMATTTGNDIRQQGQPIQPLKPVLLADVVVQGNPPPTQAPAQAPAPAYVQPAPVYAQPAPVVEAPPRRTQVIEHEQRNYMSTVAVSALMGGLAGALIGGSLYYLADDQTNPRRIIFWAAGGVLVGTGVGITQVMVQENRIDRASALHMPTDPAPTFRLALFQTRF